MPSNNNPTSNENLKSELEKCLKNCQRWGGGVVVKEGDDYDAIPIAYLNDISYTGSREVVFEIASIDDFGNVDIESQADVDFIINEMILPHLGEN